jgi:hypothetical protein
MTEEVKCGWIGGILKEVQYSDFSQLNQETLEELFAKVEPSIGSFQWIQNPQIFKIVVKAYDVMKNSLLQSFEK